MPVELNTAGTYGVPACRLGQQYMLSPGVKAVQAAFGAAARRGLVHLIAEDQTLDGRLVTLHGRPRKNFGSCSYLGLETDTRLKEAACDAIGRFGVQVASSRAYLSCPLYAELEDLLRRIFEAPLVVAQTTSLAHFAALPVLIGAGDAVLLDERVHSSVQAVVPTLRETGANCAFVRHNRPDLLEDQIRELKDRHRHIWYLADGVYSMSGAVAPFAAIRRMLDQYEQLRAYIDDAHGMTWTGRHGSGTALGQEPIHPRMIVALSLAKAFSASGAAIVFPNEGWASLVRTCGSTMIFSGPLQPALLGAAIASARIHLSSEIEHRQTSLVERIRYFNTLAEARSVPLQSAALTPIRFVTVGTEQAAHEVAVRLMDEGYFTNIATFPAVPRRRAGIRIALTLHHTVDDVRSLVEQLGSFVQEGLIPGRARARGPAAPAGSTPAPASQAT